MPKKLATAAELIVAMQKLPADAVIATLDTDHMCNHVTPIVDVKRYKDADKEFGGKVYTLEISHSFDGLWGCKA
jgi:hypothetical protein